MIQMNFPEEEKSIINPHLEDMGDPSSLYMDPERAKAIEAFNEGR